MLYLPVRAIEAFLTSARVAVNDEIQAHAALPPGEHWLGCLLGSTANLLGSTAKLLGSTANLLGSTANLLLSRNDKFLAFAQEWKPDS
jgi:hypothetical protein